MPSSTKRKTAAALEAMRERRKRKGASASAIDDYEIRDEGDVYDVLEEDDYQKLVESRRQREDFVVDDDGLGYYDDGEERLGDEDGEDRLHQKKRSSGTTHLTAAAVKRARKTKSLLLAEQRKQRGNNNNDNDDDNDGDGDGDGDGRNKAANQSMWNFVKRGAVSKPMANQSSFSAPSSGSSSTAMRSRGVATASVGLDSLLDELDEAPSKSSRSRTPSKRNRSSSMRRGRGGPSFASVSRRPHRRSGRAPVPVTARRRIHNDGMDVVDDDHGDHGPFDDNENENNDRFGNDGDNDDDGDNENALNKTHGRPLTNSASETVETEISTAMKKDQVEAKIQSDNRCNENNNDHDDAGGSGGGGDTTKKHDPSSECSEEKDAVGAAAVEENDTSHQDQSEAKPEGRNTVPTPTRRRFARPKLRASAAAQKAMEQAKAANTRAPTTTTTNASLPASTSTQPTSATATPLAVDLSSVRPDMIESVTDQSTQSAATLQSILQFNKDESVDATDEANNDESQETKKDSFIDMFWMDACEQQGDILLFGKVAVKDGFQSCCLSIHNNLRNLFVLPSRNSDGEYAPMQDVYADMKAILQPDCIPKTVGAGWASKVVEREYAFADPDIPREKTKYLKVLYDAKYPAPSPEVCREGHKSVGKILGGGTSSLENFILKRKLSGPCWIRVTNPTANTRAPVSWCKVEAEVASPKQIERLDVAMPGGKPRPAPPVVSVTIKMKTVVNPKTHKSEVVSVSAICHRGVQLDGPTKSSAQAMTQLSVIRPVAQQGVHGQPDFPRGMKEHVAGMMPQLQCVRNERHLLSLLMAQMGKWDPDVLVGHNAWGWDWQVILTRCVDLKLPMWTKVGRLRHPRTMSRFLNDWAIGHAVQGRLLCDTYLSAKELLRETIYSLTNLAASQLKTQRQEVEPVDIPQYFLDAKTVVQLAQHTLFDAQLVQQLMFKLQILPLTKQLTCIAGNLWSHTMKGNRAERTEYLLLHEFHRLKFLPPEKMRRGKDRGMDRNDTGTTTINNNNNSGNSSSNGGKAKYSGGLVLEPKKGYYDSFILLLDFNSLYPSIIQEYNLCFTTISTWSQYVSGVPVAGNDGIDDNQNDNNSNNNNLPPVPDEGQDQGVLPRVIKSLVERRRAVKKMLKTATASDERQELDIRQKALKLTANSMYGCLGFSNSRFFAQPIAAMVTAMGRETLQRTVDIATTTVGLDVIYGDTDSIMINTRISDPKDYSKVLALGNEVKAKVNGLYRTLELEIDGTFRSMLLLKKKKYAATTCDRGKNGELVYGKEMKGLDLVRRDWCVQSKDTGRYVLDQILSGDDREVVVQKIHDHLEELSKTMRAGKLSLDKYVITKGLSKHPKDYPDAKSQPHVYVARAMLAANRPVNTGDHIPYVICKDTSGSDKPATAAERARHPEEIRRSNGALEPDVEWYLTQQILPPTARLCEPIDGTSQGELATKLGLDATRYSHTVGGSAGSHGIEDDDLVDYTPASSLPDAERFKDTEKLSLPCLSCGVTSEFNGVLAGFGCPNGDCGAAFFGSPNHGEMLARLDTAALKLVHRCMRRYYSGVVRCDDPVCSLRNGTRQISVAGGVCLARGCTGRMHPEYSERALHTQLKYLVSLFDIQHAVRKAVEDNRVRGYDGDGGSVRGKSDAATKVELLKTLSKNDKVALEELHRHSKKYLTGSAFHWIKPSLWTSLFGVGVGVSAKQ